MAEAIGCVLAAREKHSNLLYSSGRPKDSAVSLVDLFPE